MVKNNFRFSVFLEMRRFLEGTIFMEHVLFQLLLANFNFLAGVLLPFTSRVRRTLQGLGSGRAGGGSVRYSLGFPFTSFLRFSLCTFVKSIFLQHSFLSFFSTRALCSSFRFFSHCHFSSIEGGKSYTLFKRLCNYTRNTFCIEWKIHLITGAFTREKKKLYMK